MRVEAVIEKARGSYSLSRAEILALLAVPLLSADYYRLLHAANELTRERAGTLGVVGAQIGLNAEPCSGGCSFCAFADSRFSGSYRMDRETVVRETKAFVDAGANYLSLMCTADYPFALFLEMSAAARSAMPADMMLSANIGDFGPEEAAALKAAGYGRVYHVLRLGEGSITALDPDARLRTLECAAAENLELAFCVEPVGPEHSDQEIADRIELSASLAPTTAAVMRRIPAAGSGEAPVGEARMAQLMAAVRLSHASTRTKTFYIHEPCVSGLLAGANLVCAERAANPREGNRSETTLRGRSVADCVALLADAGYGKRTEPNFPGSWFKGA